MRKSIVHIIFATIGIVLALALAGAAVVWGYQSKPSDEPCKALTYTITAYSDEATIYITEQELNQLLQEQDIYPVGRAVNRVSLQRMENTIRRHPLVLQAECYLTRWNEIRVTVRQRRPIVTVKSRDGAFLVDSKRRVLPFYEIHEWTLPVTGNVGAQLACTQLADFAEWLLDNDYWRGRIRLVEVRTPNNIRLRLKDYPSVIVLGRMNDYERKLRKLRTFLEDGQDEVGDKKYREIDIRFRGQVIGRDLLTEDNKN